MKLEAKWRKAVTHYVKLLRLEDWDIETSVEKLQENHGALVTFATGAKRANIALSETAPLDGKYSAEIRGQSVQHQFGTDLDRLAAHEVLHVLARPFSNMVWIVLDGWPKSTTEIINDEEETMTENLARVLATISPSGVR